MLKAEGIEKSVAALEKDESGSVKYKMALCLLIFNFEYFSIWTNCLTSLVCLLELQKRPTGRFCGESYVKERFK